MSTGSNSAERIADLRRRIGSNRGKAKRARESVMMLNYKARQCEEQIRRDLAEIESMGGKVRR